MAFLEITGLTKSFKDHKVIDGASVALEKGEFLVVFGPSGCGKTVFLRLIAGMMRPDAGDIAIDGQSMADVNPEDRDIGMAFQNYALYPHMTAFDNIASPLRSRQATGADVVERVNETARMLRIDHVLDHLPKALSQGQKQRTALARSLVGRPSVVLLDDPLRNVDAKIRYEMRFELPRVLRRYELTVIYVTQDYKEAMALGDRVAVLVDGAFRQVAAPSEIYDSPSSTRIARLFGDPPINLLPVRPTPGSRRDRDERGGRRGASARQPGPPRRPRVHVRHPRRKHRRVARAERRHPDDARRDHARQQSACDAAWRQ